MVRKYKKKDRPNFYQMIESRSKTKKEIREEFNLTKRTLNKMIKNQREIVPFLKKKIPRC